LQVLRILIRVIGPNFVAGVALDAEGEFVHKAAPIVKWARLRGDQAD
jgi:hypothetical protein